jgi:hypothetical protein
MRPMLYVFGFVAVAVSLDSIVFGGWYTQTFSNAELSILKSVWDFLPNKLGNIGPCQADQETKIFCSPETDKGPPR